MKLLITILYLTLIFILGINVGRHYVEKDCIEYTIHNPLSNYDPITLREKKTLDKKE